MNNKTKKVAPIKSQKNLEKQYQKELNQFGRVLIKAVKANVLPFLKSSKESYAKDSFTGNLSDMFIRLNILYAGTATAGYAKTTAGMMVTSLAKNNQRRFNKNIKSVTKVDLGSVLQSEGLEDFLTLSKKNNEILIKTLPEDYLKTVEQIVNRGVLSGARYSEIEKQIISKTGANAKLAKRIKVIARNEVQTINAQLSLKRSENLGIKRGVWVTADDERVRGNPSGKYPNARPSHFHANGKEFDLNKGLKIDGEYIKPGIPINCRCSFRAIIEVG